MIRVSPAFILKEFANIINDSISRLEKEGLIKPPLKDALKFESTALVL